MQQTSEYNKKKLKIDTENKLGVTSGKGERGNTGVE